MTRRPGSHDSLYSGDPDFDGVACPDCGGENVRVQSLFGGAASEVLFWCADCRACFNWVKWRGALPPTADDG